MSYCQGSSATLNTEAYVSYLWSDNSTTQSVSATAGIYYVTVTDASGCTGVSQEAVVVENPVYAVSDSASINCGGSYTLGSQTLTAAGIYTETFATISDCDSVVTLNLYMIPLYTSTDAATICEGNVYVFGTQTLTTAGSYDETFQSIDGCDSLVTLTLTVNSISTFSQTLGGCPGYSVTIGTNTYNFTGVFSDTLTAANGCDSIITTDLTIYPVYNETDYAEICNGTYQFGSQTLSNSGDYTEVFQSVNGCDSTVTLTLNVVTEYNTTASAAICAGDTFILGTQNLTMQGIYSELFQSTNGCDSTVTLTLTVNSTSTGSQVFEECEPFSVIVGTNTYSTTGVYTDVLVNAAGCDSTVTTDLTINAAITVDLGANDTLCSNNGDIAVLNAGNAGMSYLWNDNSTVQTLTVNSTLMASGDYDYAVTVTDGICTSSDTITLTVDVCADIAENKNMMNILMYPNPVIENLHISMENIQDKFSVQIYDLTGREILQKEFKNTKESVIDFTGISKGIYQVVVKKNDVYFKSNVVRF